MSRGLNLRVAVGVPVPAVKLLWWTLLVLLTASMQYLGRLTEGHPGRDVLYRYSTAVSSPSSTPSSSAVVAIAGSNRELLALGGRARAEGAGALLLLIGVYVMLAIVDPFLNGGREQGLTPTGWQPGACRRLLRRLPRCRRGGALRRGDVLPGPRVLTARSVRPLPRHPRRRHRICPRPRARQRVPRARALRMRARLAPWKTDSVFPGMLVHSAFARSLSSPPSPSSNKLPRP